MKVLVVEDDVATRTGLEQLLCELGAQAKSVATVEEARRALVSDSPDLCLTDMLLPDGDGIEVIRASRAADASREVVVLTGHGSVKSAVEAIKAGAFDFLLKPLKPAQLATLLSHFGDRRDIDKEADQLRRQLQETGRFGSLVGRSERMQQLFRVIARVARSDAPVMITGESGSGKEAAATTIHDLSRRHAVPMVAVNCGAVSPNLIESELFGHERGAFTGAEKRRIGYFEMAHGGTLFLDEVTEMSPELQVKFLRILETRTFRRVGGNEELDVDVRLISSSNRDLEDAVHSEKLRGDLYYRLNVFPLRMPTLRERRDDLELLAQHFLERIEEQEHAGVREIAAAALDLLRAYDWPGNVRELRNVIHRSYVLCDGPVIGLDTVRMVLEAMPQQRTPLPATAPASASLSATPGAAEGIVQVRVGQSLEEVEKILLKHTLDYVKGNKKRAAEMLQISLKTIYNKIKQYNLEH